LRGVFTKSFVSTSFLIALAVATATSTSAGADGFDLGSAQNYAVLFEGNGGNTLNFNNFGITGNIGVGNSGQFASAGGFSGGNNCLIASPASRL
jgi:hypothetical protein